MTWSTITATKRGNKQYPRTETDCKNEIWPPNTRVLKVMMTAPPKTEKKSKINWSESKRW